MRAVVRCLALVVAVTGAAGCRSRESAVREEAPQRAASAAPSAKVELHPVSDEAAQAALNPDHEKPYSGPIGAVRGVVHVSGAAAPDLPDVQKAIKAGTCEDGKAFYGKLFREGPGRELGDVLVAVTGYKGYVPAKGDAKVVTARGCAFESRTVAFVFGQRLDVKNRGPETFIPRLVGGTQAAYVVALPGGDPVQIFPNRVGEYELVDQTHDFAKADVFVLKFPTFAVTGIDGKFDIEGIPVGEVTVSAYLPATKQALNQPVKIVAGETATVDFTIPFEGTAPSPSPSARR